MLDKAEGRLEDIQREIDGLKLKRRDVETSIEATIQTLRNSLDYVREQEIRDRDEKILFHRPRQAEQAAVAAGAAVADDGEEPAQRSARL